MMTKFDNRPIGVFDSGLGGLTVVAALRKYFPNEDIIYLGDTARVPYGTKSQDTIKRFAIEDANFLSQKGVKLILAACNTVSAIALEELRKKFPQIPIMGVLEAGVEAIKNSKALNIAVIGTRATIMSDAYRLMLHGYESSLMVESIPCPLLVPLAEEGVCTGEIIKKVFDLYLSKLKNNPPEILFLGCTHYPVFSEALNEYFWGKTQILDSAFASSKFIENTLNKLSLNASSLKVGTERFFLSDMPNNLRETSKRFLGFEMQTVEKILLD